MESERVRRMDLAAQGLYIRALSEQFINGSLPADVEEIALALRVKASDMGLWNQVLQHFEQEAVDGEDRIYHKGLREQVEETVRLIEAKKAAGSKGGKSRAKTTSNSAKGSASSKTQADKKPRAKDLPALRASVSNSYSYSLKKELIDKFTLFWAAYPRKEAKQKALEAWGKHVPTVELAVQIIGHVEDRAKRDAAWLKDGGQYIPHPTTFLNQHRWEDTFQQVQPESRRSVMGGSVDEGADYDVLGQEDWYADPAK